MSDGYRLRWQPGPRRPWRAATWGDLGLRFTAHQPFEVDTLSQAQQARDLLEARGARVEIERAPQPSQP